MMVNAPQYVRIEIAEQRAEYENTMNDQKPAEREAYDEDYERTENMEREMEPTAGMKRKGKTGKSRGVRANHSRRANARARESEGRARGAYVTQRPHGWPRDRVSRPGEGGWERGRGT